MMSLAEPPPTSEAENNNTDDVHANFTNNISPEILKRKNELMGQIGVLNKLIAERLYEDSKIQKELHDRLLESLASLLNPTADLELALIRVEGEIRSVEGVVNKEIKLQEEDERINRDFPLIIIVYIALIVLAVILGGMLGEKMEKIPVIGIPTSVLIWASIGSLAAILYRFYARQPGRMRKEYRWLIARPIIGIIMGALMYLAVLAGYIVIGTSSGQLPPLDTTHPEIFWIVAFLGGFSDKFFEAIIENLVGRFSGLQPLPQSNPQEK